MSDELLERLRRRSMEEREAANRAADRGSARLHAELAESYEAVVEAYSRLGTMRSPLV